MHTAACCYRSCYGLVNPSVTLLLGAELSLMKVLWSSPDIKIWLQHFFFQWLLRAFWAARTRMLSASYACWKGCAGLLIISCHRQSCLYKKPLSKLHRSTFSYSFFLISSPHSLFSIFFFWVIHCATEWEDIQTVEKSIAQVPFLLFQVIIEQKCKTPSNAVAAPKPHLKPVGDLVLYLMIAKQDNFRVDRMVSGNMNLIF